MIEQIKQLIADELHIDSASIADDADIIEDLGADSLSVVTIIMNAEDEFGLSIPDELVADLRTPAAMAEYLKNNKK
ncbi:MAG: acyl carrier protein [Clostridia bacterium]|nr:acyl carrier protein [Clostridia bacterium]